MPLELDLCLGKGSRLIRAQDIHRTKILDRRQPLHDDARAGHAQRTPGKRDRNQPGQQIRRQPDCKRDGEGDQDEYQRIAETTQKLDQ